MTATTPITEAKIISYDANDPATNPAIAPENKESPYSDLPNELLEYIFSFLDIPHLLVVGQLDRYNYNVSSGDDLWKNALPIHVIESLAKDLKSQGQKTSQSNPAVENITVKLQKWVKPLFSQVWSFAAQSQAIGHQPK